MAFLLVSFVAGLLTVLAPCILPLLPVVVGSSASGRSKATPYIVVGALTLSIILFTYVLKVSTAFVTVPEAFWTYLSGGILIIFGLILVFPGLWERIPGMAKFSAQSNKLVGSGYQKKSFFGDALMGAALGPVFSSCSPTYFVILASVLPASFARGTLYLLAYVAGLGLMLLLIALLGQRFADRLVGFSDSRSALKRGIGVVFVALGLLVATGYEAKLEAWLLNRGFDVTNIEQGLLLRVQNGSGDMRGEPYKELVAPAGFVNSGPFTIGEFIGKKVILLDFLTYSCINCQRTFPFLNAWDEKYRDQGLLIIGIHTPEFSFEKNIDNVQKAMREFGITHPVVLDNEYGTWNAYGNNYWPRKYLIDINGNIVYDHIGEGAYDETEMKIRELLAERARVLGAQPLEEGALASEGVAAVEVAARSPETYFGSDRNLYLGNGAWGAPGAQTLTVPAAIAPNTLYLGGTWHFTPEYASNAEAGASIVYRFNAKSVYFVAGADAPVEVEIVLDGVSTGTKTIQAETLYPLVSGAEPGEHTLELRVKTPGLKAYTFTFG